MSGTPNANPRPAVQGRAGRDAIEHASQDELRSLQLERLKWSLRHAYDNVPHYRKSFDAAGVHPDDLKELADLARFPFTTKQDLRDNYPFGMFAVPRESIVRIHASSGTTGKPTVVGYTARDIDNWSDLVARPVRAAGGRPGDTLHVAYGGGRRTALPLDAREEGAQGTRRQLRRPRRLDKHSACVAVSLLGDATVAGRMIA